MSRRAKRKQRETLTRRLKANSNSPVLIFYTCHRNWFTKSLAMSAPELALCCGQLAAINGGGHVAKLNALGLDSSVAPNKFVVVIFQPPGMRKVLYLKLSMSRSRSVRRRVNPRSPLTEMRLVRAEPVASKLRTRLRVISPLKVS